jgi:hypothetical protein
MPRTRTEGCRAGNAVRPYPKSPARTEVPPAYCLLFSYLLRRSCGGICGDADVHVHRVGANVTASRTRPRMRGVRPIRDRSRPVTRRYGTLRIVILHHGDYAESYRRARTADVEVSHAERRSVESVASLALHHEVTTIAVCGRPHDELLAPGLRSIGVALYLVGDPGRLGPLLARFEPEALICRVPNRFALAWAARRRIPVLSIRSKTLTSHTDPVATEKAQPFRSLFAEMLTDGTNRLRQARARRPRFASRILRPS